MEIEFKKIEAKKVLNMKFDHERGEIRLFGTRIALTNLLPACEKIDKMFGTGGEVIINCMAFEQGRQLFDALMMNSPEKRKVELLNEVIKVQPQIGWGITSLKIISHNPPKVKVTVKNSPVKTLHGSSKHWIGSFWAGVLSKHFSKQLKCTSFSYDEIEDELHCIISNKLNKSKTGAHKSWHG